GCIVQCTYMYLENGLGEKEYPGPQARVVEKWGGVEAQSNKQDFCQQKSGEQAPVQPESHYPGSSGLGARTPAVLRMRRYRDERMYQADCFLARIRSASKKVPPPRSVRALSNDPGSSSGTGVGPPPPPPPPPP